jgi:hypothetical protein
MVSMGTHFQPNVDYPFPSPLGCSHPMNSVLTIDTSQSLQYLYTSIKLLASF